MPDDNQQDDIHSSSNGGVLGKHSDPDLFEFFVAPATSSEFNTARLRLIPIACFRIDDVRFKFDSSFVLPEVKSEMTVFAELRKQDQRVNGAPLSIFGHADPSYRGNFEIASSTAQPGDDYNKTLSGRRALAIYALLIRDPSFWNTLYVNHLGGDIWGEGSISIMLNATDPAAPAPATSPSAQSSSISSSQSSPNQSSAAASSQSSSDSARNARIKDIANDSGQRQQLFLKYMNFLCGDLKLDKSSDFLARAVGPDLKGDVQGCGRFNPVLLFSSEEEALYKQAFVEKNEAVLRGKRDQRNSPNRRVMILIYRKGSRILPAKWPCPTYREGIVGCKKRLWSDGDNRRSLHLSGEERQFDQSQNTFACRFYQRISSDAPCEGVTAGNDCFIYLKLFDDLFTNVLVNKPYKIRGLQRGWTIDASTDADGVILLENVPDDHYELQCDGKIEIVEVFYMVDRLLREGKPWFMRVRDLQVSAAKDS